MGNEARKLKLIDTPPDDLQTRAAAEQTKQDDLAKVARSAEHAAQLAAIQFAQNPRSAGALDEKQITAQEAVNARQLADEHAVSVGDLLRQARIERETAELAALRPRLGANGSYGTQRERLVDMIAEFRKNFRCQLAATQDSVAEQRRLLSKADALARSLGIDERFGSVSLQGVLTEVAASLVSGNWQHDRTGYVSLSINTQDGSPTGERFKLEMSAPIFGDKS
jgi:hypothetical protein